MNLTPRWTQLRYHPEQNRLWNSPTRFKTVPAGRRSGKTELAKRYLVKKALKPTNFPDPKFFAAAPTRDQAKRIYWQDLKAMVPTWALACKPSESELKITTVLNSEIHVLGMDKPERIEGSPWDGGILDEYGNMKKEAWGEHVRPALSDRLAWCWFIGVPEGRNHYYELDRSARADDTGQWEAFHWVSADILPAEEIEAARRDLDELTFQQEYEASFITFSGRAYYPFDERYHCRRLEYDKKQPLIFTFDFNVAPGTANVLQEMQAIEPITGLPLVGHAMTGVIGEVHIPRASNTEYVCNRLGRDWKDHEGEIWCYGDSTGGAQGTAKVYGSDWEIVSKTLRKHFGNRVRFKVPRMNPRERVRVNSVNSRLKSIDGFINLMVDHTRCPYTVKDFEGVCVVEGGSGELDKKTDPDLTHHTDGIGYYVHIEHPIGDHEVEMQTII